MRRSGVVVYTSVATVAVGLASIAIYSSCGNTGGGVNPAAALAQFVSPSCTPAGNACLTMTVPNTVPADGTTLSGFRASLVDGSGAPLPGVQICFHFEDPDVATIVEPTDLCGLVDSNGFVSGQFRDGVRTGSFQLVADVGAGFALETRRTISFLQSANPIGPGNPGSPCSTTRADGGCAFGFCSFQDACHPGPSLCTAQEGTGGCCTSNVECASSTCDAATSECLGTGEGVGAPCTSDSNCNSNLFCTFGDACFPGQRSCQSKNSTGGCCTVNAECANNVCDLSTNTCAAATPSPAPTATATVAVPTVGPTSTPAPLPQGSLCTIGTQCSSGTCKLGTTFPGCPTSSCCAGSTGDPCSPNGANPQCKSGTCTAGSCT